MGLSGLAQRALVDAERALAHVDDAGTRSLALVSYALAFSRTHGPAHYADSRRLLTEALGSQDRRGMTFRLEALRNQLRIEAAEAGDDRVLFGGGRLERADGAGGHGGPVPADVLAQVAQAYWDRGRLDQVRTWALGTVASREADAGRLGRRVLTLRFLPAASKTLVVGSGPAGPIAYAVDAGAERLAGDIRLVQRALSAAHPGRARDQLAAAFTTLLGPARQQLRAATDLVILPGPIVERVPFAALFDVERQRYLIQDVVVHYGSLEPTRRSTGAAAALIVGAGDDAGGGRPRLAEVAREVEQLRQIHAGAAVLRGGADSKGQLLAQLPEAGLFHFAGHAQLNLARADLSRLILGDETSPRAALTAREIAQMHLPRLDVAVLSACSTAGNLALSREGHGGLAAAFLGAGARSVVATLWDVPDNTSRIVTIELHRRLREGAGVGRALQAAQLAALAGHPGGPAGWAAFIAVHR
jgi:CHAT domain-containing protein